MKLYICFTVCQVYQANNFENILITVKKNLKNYINKA